MESSKEQTTPTAALPPEGYATLEPGPAAAPPALIVDPNNPPWGLPIAVLTWLGSIGLLIGMNSVVLIFYDRAELKGSTVESLEQLLATDKTFGLLLILSTIPAHLLTLGLAWAVITRFGRRPFWRALGWTWSKRVGFWTSVGLAAALYAVCILIILLFGGQITSLDQMVASSRAVALAIAFTAVFTAPLAEEVVYRGILYPTLQRTIGVQWAVVGVLLLFTLVHVPQYWPNFAVIGAVGMLSLSLTLVRAYTGSLLPCFVMHLAFNGIQSILIILQPYMPISITGEEQKAALVILFSRFICLLT